MSRPVQVFNRPTSPKTKSDVAYFLDVTVDNLAMLLSEGPKDDLDMHVHMYVDLDRIHGELQDILTDYYKRTKGDS